AQAAFSRIERRVKEAFPGVPVRWAYTSAIIRKKLARQGKQLDSTATALAKMMDEGFTHVAVQSLHTIGGEEYHDLVGTVRAFRMMPEGIDHLQVGYPLLGTEEDLMKVTEALLENLPPQRTRQDAVVLMGHGTPHPANAFYTALMYHLQRRDPNLYVATVEGAPGIDEVTDMLRRRGITTAYLIPFMSVAGDHARNDMAGDDEDSWKNVLARAGIDAKVVLKGTAEYDNIVDIWVDHLRTVLRRFEPPAN
ncbi:MAG: sirohydrochlorin cobaltochelatase, partial [Alphaproteobacteria bacterium]